MPNVYIVFMAFLMGTKVVKDMLTFIVRYPVSALVNEYCQSILMIVQFLMPQRVPNAIPTYVIPSVVGISILNLPCSAVQAHTRILPGRQLLKVETPKQDPDDKRGIYPLYIRASGD